MRRLPINQSAKPQLASSTPATNQKPNAGFTASQNGRPRGKSRSWEQLCSHELPLTMLAAAVAAVVRPKWG